jgi:transposase-like protein
MRNLFQALGSVTIIIWLLSGVSCKSAKTIQTAINKKDTATLYTLSNPDVDSAAIIEQITNKLKEREIQFTSFSSRVKVDYTDQSGKSQSATALIRLQKDSIMWVSLTGTLGVEGFRAIIRPDSVWVMDKLEKTISRRSTAFLQEITNLPLDFEALQDIVVGNPVYFSENNIVSYRTEANTISALSIGEYFKHLLTIDTVSNQLLRSKIDDIDATRNRTCFIGFDAYASAQGRSISTKREISVTEKTNLNVKLDFKQYAFDESLTFPFNIPKNYREK